MSRELNVDELKADGKAWYQDQKGVGYEVELVKVARKYATFRTTNYRAWEFKADLKTGGINPGYSFPYVINLSVKRREDAEKVARDHLRRNGIEVAHGKVDLLKVYEAVKGVLTIE